MSSSTKKPKVIVSITELTPMGHHMKKGDKMMDSKAGGKKFISDSLKVPYGASKGEKMATDEAAQDEGEGDEFSAMFGGGGEMGKGKDLMKMTLGEASVDDLKAALAAKQKEEKPGAAPGEEESDMESEDEDMA